MNDVYVQGFVDKCASLGINPEALVKLSQQRYGGTMAGPATLGAMSGAPWGQKMQAGMQAQKDVAGNLGSKIMGGAKSVGNFMMNNPLSGIGAVKSLGSAAGAAAGSPAGQKMKAFTGALPKMPGGLGSLISRGAGALGTATAGIGAPKPAAGGPASVKPTQGRNPQIQG